MSDSIITLLPLWIANDKLFKIKSRRSFKLYFVLHNIKFSWNSMVNKME
jgi:hypothetical protein